MTPQEFVELFYKNKTEYLRDCFDEHANLFVSKKIKSLNLDDKQKKIMAEIVDVILTDTYYEILLGIDGCANIGGLQIDYKVYDDEGNLLTDGGEIQSYAGNYFQSR